MVSCMTFRETVQNKTAEIEEIIARFLPKEEGLAKTVLEAMNYSVSAGGKRLRPMLMQETYRMYGGEGAVIWPFMAAIEMIHTYSLVHDDLPAMDNDEYRRGRKTTHVVYGEAMAILAGDGLLTYAFETASKAFAIEGADAGRIGRAMNILAGKAGIDGMLGGQAVDVEAEKKRQPLNMEQLLYIHEKKTAALIQLSLMVGATLAGATQEEIEKLEQIGYCVGVAFQIRDDILDVEGTLEELGKPIGSDEKNQKITYVSLVGMEKAKKDVEEMSEKAILLMDKLTQKNEFLKELIQSLVYRNH